MSRPAATRRAADRRRAPAPASSAGHVRLVLGAVALGGAIGALGRHGLALLWPTPSAAFPWATFVVNVTGCFAIGLLLVAVTETSGNPHPLARPFLGTGVIGGFTTFSTYGVDVHALLAAGRAGAAAAYLLGTVAAALTAGQLGIWTARLLMQATRGTGSALGGRVR